MNHRVYCPAHSYAPSHQASKYFLMNVLWLDVKVSKYGEVRESLDWFFLCYLRKIFNLCDYLPMFLYHLKA